MRFYLALILVALWATSARAIEPADYKYPYPDPYLAGRLTTALPAIAKPY